MTIYFDWPEFLSFEWFPIFVLIVLNQSELQPINNMLRHRIRQNSTARLMNWDTKKFRSKLVNSFNRAAMQKDLLKRIWPRLVSHESSQRKHIHPSNLTSFLSFMQKICEKPQVVNDYEAGRGIPNNVILGKIERVIGVKLRGSDVGKPLLPPGAKKWTTWRHPCSDDETVSLKIFVNNMMVASLHSETGTPLSCFFFNRKFDCLAIVFTASNWS